MDARFLLQRGDRAYVVYDDSDTIFNEGSSPVGVPLKYIGLLQGSKTSGNWDLLWLYFGSDKPYGIVTQFRNGKWSSYTSSWFPILLKDCNEVGGGFWSKIAMISNHSAAIYQTQWVKELPVGHLEFFPLHVSNSSFNISFGAGNTDTADGTLGSCGVDNILMSSLIAAHGGSPA